MPNLSKKCVQLVSTYMNNEWVQLPQVIQNLWTSDMSHTKVSPLSAFFLYFTHSLPTTLFASKSGEITDKKPYLSTLSTLPITMTTIYI